MREDMSKVIVERPRRGGSFNPKPGRTRVVLDDEGMPTRAREQVKRPQRTKSLNENLAPLQRFLVSRAGKPWDKVRSEISEHLKPSSTVQQHVIDHLGDLVAMDVAWVDDQWMVTHRRFGRRMPLAESGYRLFVHPRSGLLLKNEAWRSWSTRRRERDDPAARRRDLGPFRQAHLFGDGAWWDVVLEGDPTVVQKVFDSGRRTFHKSLANVKVEDAVHAAGLSDMPLAQLYGRAAVHAVSVRRMTKAERKKLQLD